MAYGLSSREAHPGDDGRSADGLKTDPRLRVYTLGRFEVHAGDRLVIDDSWSRSRAKAILKLLAVERGSLSRDQVIETLWPQSDAAAGGNSLRQSLHHLRTAFAAGGVSSPVTSNDESLSLCADVWTDVAAFRSAARAARASRKDILPYEKAVDLYKGDLLPHDVYEDWVQHPRDDLKALHLRLLSELADLCRSDGRCETAEELLLRVLQADPMREEEHRTLMRVYMHCGRRAEAARQYQVCRDVLKQELGVEPSAETEALYREVMNGDLEPGPATAAAAPRTPSGNGRSAKSEERRPKNAPPVRYATATDGVSIAYWTLGDGPPLVVMPRIPFSHLGHEWEIQEWRAWYERLAQGRTVIRYDPRGTGLSERSVADYSLESLEMDIDAVTRSLDLDRFDLFGFGHSCPVAVHYAALNQERVRRLMLWCPYSRGKDFWRSPKIRAFQAMRRRDWELYTDTAARAVLGWSEGEAPRRFAHFMRESMDQPMAEKAFRAISRFDVTDVLCNLRTPALALVRDGLSVAEIVEAKRFASRAGNAQLRVLHGPEAVPFLGNVDEVLAAIEAFLNEARPASWPSH